MALNGLFCADAPLRNYALTHSIVSCYRHTLFDSRVVRASDL